MSTFQAVAVTRLYRMIADQIAGRIRAGDFPRGRRLPSERDLAQQLGLSRMTVVNAYREVAARGLVRGHVGRAPSHRSWTKRASCENRLQRR